MPSTRLFLGGLSDKINRQDVGAKLSHYGPVLSIDLKEKTDPEGNILFRFAYVNVDASPAQIEQCIQQLHGTSWKGSHLRVERAKESFLERLNRERAARQQGNKMYPERLNNNNLNTVPIVGETENSKEHQACPEKHVSKGSDSNQSKKRKDNNSLEKELSPRKKTSLHDTDKVSQTDARSDPSKREKKKKKHEVEEKMLSSFKKFSSVWADSDNENEEGDFQAGRGESHEEQQDEVLPKPAENEDSDATVDEDSDKSESDYSDTMEERRKQLKILKNLDDTDKSLSKAVGEQSAVREQVTRQDTTQPEDQENMTAEKTMHPEPGQNNKYVKVAKDLSFGQNASGFSLLAHFSRLHQEEVQKEEVAAPVSVPKTLITVQQKVKKRPFFIAGDDPEIEGAIEWMTQPITQEIIKEFEESLPDLRQVIKTRSFRARKEEADPRGQRRGRGRGRGQGRGRPMAGSTGNPYRDHRWRERAVKK